MRLVILDPSLDTAGSHHFAYASALVGAARARGWDASVVANNLFPFGDLNGAGVVHHFGTTGYPPIGGDPVRGRYDTFAAANDALLRELRSLPASVLAGPAILLCPTATAYQLGAFANWRLEAAATDSLLALWLMLPTGIALDDRGAIEVRDPLMALFLKLSLDRMIDGDIALFGSGGAHAAEYGALVGRPIETHALILSIDPTTRGQNAGDLRQILLHAGDAKLNKGLAFVPELARLVRTSLPGWRSAIHANFTTAGGEALAIRPVMDRLVLDDLDIVLEGGMVPAERYSNLFASSSAAVLAYEPEEYRTKSSGVLWETLAMGLPTVLPADTWLEQEARRWGGAYETFERWTPGAIFAAIRRLTGRIDIAQRDMVDVSKRFASANTPAIALDQLERVFNARPRPLSRRAPISTPRPRTLEPSAKGQQPAVATAVAKPARRWFGRPAAVKPAAQPPVASVSREADAIALSARRTTITEYYSSPGWSHLRLQFDGSKIGDVTRDLLTFKVFRMPDAIGLEFRPLEGSGEHPFLVFPGEDKDEFGPYYRVAADLAGDNVAFPFEERLHAPDRQLIETIIKAIRPTLAEASIVIGHLDMATQREWVEASTALAKALASHKR